MQNPYLYPLDDVAHRISAIRSQLDDEVYIVNSQQIARKVIDIEIALCMSQQLATRAPRHS